MIYSLGNSTGGFVGLIIVGCIGCGRLIETGSVGIGLITGVLGVTGISCSLG